MSRRMNRGLRGAVAAVAAVALVAGCGSSNDDGESQKPGAKERTYEEGMIGVKEGGDPVSGGSLSFSGFSEPASLDPAVTIAAGSTGGVEMAAVFDTLMRYDTTKQDFVPQLAESLSPNDDHSEWTLTLRDGVTFSDGTPLDSAAVKWSQERYVEKGGPETALWAGNVTSIETPDAKTVVYKLNGPWVLFPSILSTGPGMIVAKASDAGAKFNPVGAGPFVFSKWAPQEEIVFTANEKYWDGRPPLDEFRSVVLGDQLTSIESMESGSLDMAFIRDPDKADRLLDEGVPGYMAVTAASNVAVINASEGRPGADVRVRKALAMGINPELIRERANKGHGIAQSTLFPEYSRWHGETEGLPYDPEEAKKLLEEAKADGYDGKITYHDQSDPVSRAVALVVKANLEQIGFEVELDLARSVADTISKVAANRDYDLAAWGLNFREGDPFSKMFSTTHSESPATLGMPTSPEMDELLTEFKGASEQSDQARIMDEVQQVTNEQVPYLNWGPIAEYTAWTEKVHGVVGGMNSIVHLGNAWVG